MISRRGDKWAVRVWDKGTQKMRWVGSFASRDEARAAEARATLAPRRGVPVTVAEFCSMWLSDYAREAKATQRNYRYGSKRVLDDLGAMLLSDVDRPMARRMAAVWPRASTRVAKTMFGDAMRDGLIEANPFSEMRLETPRGRKDLDALTEQEIVELADLARTVHGPSYGPEARAIVLTLAYVGCRPGELCSLRWEDLDLERRRVTIRFNTDATGAEKSPKNGKPRVVIVPPLAMEAIRSMPDSIAPDGRIFHTVRGRPFAKGTLAYFWRPIATAWQMRGGKHLQMYELRHACATLLRERGLQPSDVAVQLGHQDGGRLISILYGHPRDELALDRLEMAAASAAPDGERRVNERWSA